MSNLIIVTDSTLYDYARYSSSVPFNSSSNKAVELLDLDAEGFDPEVSCDDIKSVFLYDRRDPLDYYKTRVKDARSIHFLATEKCLQQGGLLYGFFNRVFSLGLGYNSSDFLLEQAFAGVKAKIQVCICDSEEEHLDTFNAFFRIQGFASCVEILEAAGIEYTFSTCKASGVVCEYMVSA
jgi:putative NADPH-quinone reductase